MLFFSASLREILFSSGSPLRAKSDVNLPTFARRKSRSGSKFTPQLTQRPRKTYELCIEKKKSKLARKSESLPQQEFSGRSPKTAWCKTRRDNPRASFATAERPPLN